MAEVLLTCDVSKRIPYDEAQLLWSDSVCADVFNHPGCWRSLIESGVHPGSLACLEVRDANGRLFAVWPFIIKRAGAKDMFAKIAEPLGAHYLDYIAPIVSTCYQEQSKTCLIAGIAELFRSCGKMRLPKLMPGEMHSLTSGKSNVKPFASFSETLSSPRLLFGANYEETELTLGWGKKHRPSVRLRRMQKEGNVSLWVAKDKSEILKHLPNLYKLHRQRWNSQRKPSQFDRPEEQTCFKLLATYLPMELLHYSELQLENKVLSCHFGFLSNVWLYWYKPAHDVSYNRFSPGMLHIAMLARHGIDCGWRGMDFLQGDESYKFRWANDGKETIKLTMSDKYGYPWWLWETRWRNMFRVGYLQMRQRTATGKP